MEIALTVIILVVSIIAHEVAHGYAANALGDPTARLAGRLTMNPLPHIDPLGSVILPALLVFSGSPMLFGWAKPVPYNPYNLKNQRFGESIVAVAGSATNLVIAVIFGLFIRFGVGTFSPEMLSLAATIAFTNLFLGLFNLIPFPPLDGFTFIRGLLPYRLAGDFQRFEEHMRSMGIMSLVLFIIVFTYVFAGPFATLVGWIFRALIGG